MDVMDDRRIETLEELTRSLSSRVDDLEARTVRRSSSAPAGFLVPSLGPPAAAYDRVRLRNAAEEAATDLRPAHAQTAPARAGSTGGPGGNWGADAIERLDDLVGGRMLAWLGGLVVIVGIVFFFTYAVSHGWLGETARVVLGGVACAALLGFGISLHERRGQTEAAGTVTAVAIVGLFMTVFVASHLYSVIPGATGFILAVGVGGLATYLALRWDSQVIAALGIVGALMAPAVLGVPDDAGTLVLLLAAASSAVGVLVWRRWDWLAFSALFVCACQWVPFLLDGSPGYGTAVAMLVGFGVLGGLAAIGFELRMPEVRLRPSSSLLLALNAAVLAVVGAIAMTQISHHTLGAVLWIGTLSAAHFALAHAARRARRVSADITLLLFTLAVLLADTAFALLATGPVLAIGWTLASVGFAYFATRRMRPGHARLMSEVGLGGHLFGGVIVAGVQAAQVHSLGHGGGDVAAVLAVSAVAVGSLISGRLTRPASQPWRIGLDTVGLALTAYLSVMTLHGVPLVVAWSLEAVTLAAVARRTGDELAGLAALLFLTAAGIYGCAVEAPVRSLVFGVHDLPVAAAALGASIVASAVIARMRITVMGRPAAPALIASATLSLLYLASVAIITAFQPADPAVGIGVLDLAVRQEGQLLLSGLLGVTGVAALIVGLRSDHRTLRLGALGLLLVTAAKVCIYDLATLDSIYRIVSFIAIGLLLLAGAYAYQRLRPESARTLGRIAHQ